MRDSTALTREDVDEYAGWTAQLGGLRTIVEVYWESERGTEVNEVQIAHKLECSVLSVGGDFFFGEVPRGQMELVAKEVRGVVIRSGRNIALEQLEELAKAYLEVFHELR